MTPEILTMPLQVNHIWAAIRPLMFRGGQNLLHLHFLVFRLAIGQRIVNGGFRSGLTNAGPELRYYIILVAGSTTSGSQSLRMILLGRTTSSPLHFSMSYFTGSRQVLNLLYIFFSAHFFHVFMQNKLNCCQY
jgi:hypothetical protein